MEGVDTVRRKSRDIGIIYMMSNIGITAAVFYLPLLLRDRSISDVEIGLLAIPYSLALFLSNSIFGKMNDKYGRRPFLLVGLFSSSLSTVFYIIPYTVELYALARIFNGISLGVFPSAIIAIASDRKTPMGELSSWRAFGWAIGAILNGILAEVWQLELAFIAGGFLFFVGFFIAYVKDTGGIVDSATQQSLKDSRPPPQYKRVISQNWQIYLTVILRHGSGAAIWVYWTLFLQSNLSLNNFQIGIVLAINTITQTIVMRYFGDIGNSQHMFLVGTFLSALAFLSFPLTTNFLQISLTQILLGVSFSFFLVGGLRLAEIRGTKLGMVGTATGLFEASFSISQLIGPILAIIIFSRYKTYTSLMYYAAAISILGTIFYGVISLRKPINGT